MFTRICLALLALMMRNLFGFIIMVVATFVAVVACSPNSRKVQVAHVNDGALNAMAKQTAALCATHIPRGQKIKTHSGSSVNICKLPDLNDTPEVLDETANAKGESADYRLTNRPIQFAVNNNRGRLEIALKMGLVFPKEVSLDNKTKAVNWISSTCIPHIQQVWKNSKLQVDLNVSVNQVVDESVSFDQKVELDLLPGSDGSKTKTTSAFNMKHWPDRAFFYPNVKEMKNLENQKKYLDSNRRFCQNFAVLVGNFLGLESDHSKETSKCATSAPPVSASPAPVTQVPPSVPETTTTTTQPEQPSEESAVYATGFDEVPAAPVAAKDVPFMTVAADPDHAPSSFWQTARFSSTDLAAILHSACDSVKKPATPPATASPAPSKPSASPTPAPAVDELEKWK